MKRAGSWRWDWSLVLLSALSVIGCAPTLSTFTPAHVPKAGHIQAEVGTDVSWPTGTLDRLVDSGKAAANAAEGESLTEAQQQAVLKAATSLLLNPPSMNSHLGIGVGVVQNLEVSGRWVSGGWRLGSRYQFLQQDRDGIALSAGVGVGHYGWSNSMLDRLNDINDAFGIDLVRYHEYSRWQFDLPLLVGKAGTWYRWWTGPKLLLCKYHTSLDVNQNPGGVSDRVGFTLDGLSTYFGALIGAAVGYKYVFLAAELTVVRFDTRAHFSASTGSSATPYDPRVGGMVIYPGLGLMGEF